jgi:hypothetical protein
MADAQLGALFAIHGLGVGSGAGAARALALSGAAAVRLSSSSADAVVDVVWCGADLVELWLLRRRPLLELAQSSRWVGWFGSRRSERRGRPWASSRVACAGWRPFPPV